MKSVQINLNLQDNKEHIFYKLYSSIQIVFNKFVSKSSLNTHVFYEGIEKKLYININHNLSLGELIAINKCAFEGFDNNINSKSLLDFTFFFFKK